MVDIDVREAEGADDSGLGRHPTKQRTCTHVPSVYSGSVVRQPRCSFLRQIKPLPKHTRRAPGCHPSHLSLAASHIAPNQPCCKPILQTAQLHDRRQPRKSRRLVCLVLLGLGAPRRTKRHRPARAGQRCIHETLDKVIDLPRIPLPLSQIPPVASSAPLVVRWCCCYSCCCIACAAHIPLSSFPTPPLSYTRENHCRMPRRSIPPSLPRAHLHHENPTSRRSGGAHLRETAWRPLPATAQRAASTHGPGPVSTPNTTRTPP